MRGLTSAQRDMMIYGELRRMNLRLDRVYTDWFGDAEIAVLGHKAQVIANTAFRAGIESGYRSIKWFLGVMATANIGAWFWFFQQMPR
jgi:hypothetical protein